MRKFTLAIGIVFGVFSIGLNAAPKDITLRYAASNGVVEAAELTLSLRGNGSHYVFRGDTLPVGAGKLFAAALTKTERSEFKVIDGNIQTTAYESQSKKSVKQWTRTEQDGARLDQFNILMQIALDLDNNITEATLQYRSPDNEIKDFSWKVVSEGSITVKDRVYQVKKIHRQSGDRKIISWHSKALQWLPVQMEFYQGDTLKIKLMLSES